MIKTDNYRAIAPYYDLFINWEERLKREIPFLLEIAGAGNGNFRLLDIGCGTGRHFKVLKDAGFEVEGSEPSRDLRELAHENLEDVKIYSDPMENLEELAARYGPWQLITCLGNTLAHLPPDKVAGFCRGLTRASARGATAVLHLLNYEKIMSERPEHLPPKLIEFKDKIYRFERRYRYFPEHIEFSIRVVENGKTVALDQEVLYPLTADTLRQACLEGGFKDIHLYGAFDSRIPYSTESNDLVVVLRKS